MDVLEYLIGQSKFPKGFVGKIMLKIMNNAHKKIYYKIVSQMNINENYNILDIGCGGGEFIRIVSKKYRNIKLFGIDISEDAIEIAIKNNRNENIIFSKSDIGKMPFENNYFNIVTAFQTYYHWNNIKNNLKEIYRILNNNGILIIVAELYKVNYHMTEYKKEEEIKKLFTEIGFKNAEYKEEEKYMYIRGEKV
jgi:ubiquinone/menaquinone biosynthesis C-methylase UbiE